MRNDTIQRLRGDRTVAQQLTDLNELAELTEETKQFLQKENAYLAEYASEIGENMAQEHIQASQDLKQSVIELENFIAQKQTILATMSTKATKVTSRASRSLLNVTANKPTKVTNIIVIIILGLVLLVATAGFLILPSKIDSQILLILVIVGFVTGLVVGIALVNPRKYW